VATSVGQRGYSIDTEKVRRLDYIIEWCETTKSSDFVDLASAYAEQIQYQWDKGHVDFGAAVDTLSTMKDSEWFLEHGGRAIYRTILDGLLSRVGAAWANDWIRLLQLPEQAVSWTDGDERLLSTGLDYYRETGFRYEQEQCEDTSEMAELKNSLVELEQKYSLGLSHTITLLEESIQEQEHSAHHDDEEAGGFSHRASLPITDAMSEDDVRGMFSGLLPRCA
jgi:hypothetical protein